MNQDELKQWFEDHPFISVSAVSKAMGWKRGVLSEKLVGRFRKPLTPDELKQLSAFLKKYDGEQKIII